MNVVPYPDRQKASEIFLFFLLPVWLGVGLCCFVLWRGKAYTTMKEAYLRNQWQNGGNVHENERVGAEEKYWSCDATLMKILNILLQLDCFLLCLCQVISLPHTSTSQMCSTYACGFPLNYRWSAVCFNSDDLSRGTCMYIC